MITVEKAYETIFNTLKDFGTERVSLDQAIGRVLAEDIQADRDLPPYDRVTRDGIAIRYSAFAEGKRSFPVDAVAPAGSPQMKMEMADHCLEVMTGAILPEGCDTVLMYEEIDIKDGVAHLQTEAVDEGQYIHYQGQDRKGGDIIIKAGRRMSPAEVGLAAAVGKASLQVKKMPRCMVISTGDELVEVHETPLAHQIRRSNVYRLKTTLERVFGIAADTHHLKDDMEAILRDLKRIMDEYDVVMLSGGVSKGKFDFLPSALEQLGVEKLFHKIYQRPGKPFWFGKSPQGSVIFALPGNPVSSFMCTQCYFVPWLEASLGLPEKSKPQAILQADVQFKPDLTYFLAVQIGYNDQGQMLAKPVEGNGSGDLANLVDADAFVQLPRGKDVYEAGEVYPVVFYR
ncbi:MAG: molybdopterin molybdotransferase MoeA [Bacteroidota bacterium]